MDVTKNLRMTQFQLKAFILPKFAVAKTDRALTLASR